MRRVAKLGGVVQMLADLDQSFDIAVFDGRVYVTALEGGLVRMNKDGSARQTVDSRMALDLAARGDTLYFGYGADSGGVVRVRPPESIVQLTSTNPASEGVAVDDASIYWIEHAHSGAIWRADLNGLSPTKLATVSPGPRRIALDAEAIYCTVLDGVVRLPKRGGDATKIYTGEVRFGSLVIDDELLYVTLENSDSVVRMNKRDGSGVVALVSGLRHPVGLAQDAEALYFTERSAGGIWRLPK